MTLKQSSTWAEKKRGYRSNLFAIITVVCSKATDVEWVISKH